MSNKKVFVILILLSSLIFSSCTSLDYKIFDSLGIHLQSGNEFVIDDDEYNYDLCYYLFDEKDCLDNSECVWITYYGYEGKEGYCDYKSCDNTFNEIECMNNGLNCTWKTFNFCQEASCLDFDSKIDCVKSDDLDCLWDEGYCYNKDCYQYDSKDLCLNNDDDLECIWNNAGCTSEKNGCFNFYSNDSCTNNEFNCIWDGEFCNIKSCYDLKNSEECFNTNLDHCEWDEEFQQCYTDDCLFFNSEESCNNKNSKGFNCKWKESSNCYSNDLTWY